MENLVGYAKADLMVPNAPLKDLTAANAAATRWCAEVNTVTHSEICAVPVDRLDTERDLLGALPSLRPSLGPPPVSRKVDKLSTIRFGSARYSVANQLIGTTVTIVADAQMVTVVAPVTGEVLAQHCLVPPGETSILDEHYGSSRPDRPRRAPRPKTAAEKQFLAPAQTPRRSWQVPSPQASATSPTTSARSSPCPPLTANQP